MEQESSILRTEISVSNLQIMLPVSFTAPHAILGMIALCSATSIFVASSCSHVTIDEGEYFHGTRHGSGVFKWAEGHTYVGNFVDDAMEGEGTFTCESFIMAIKCRPIFILSDIGLLMPLGDRCRWRRLPRRISEWNAMGHGNDAVCEWRLVQGRVAHAAVQWPRTLRVREGWRVLYR